MKAVIIAGGKGELGEAERKLAEEADLLICADGGARKALRQGLRPHVVIGDMDSLEETTLSYLREMGVPLLMHPAAKDETDLELALHHALERGAKRITILGAFGGRVDHTLANVLLLALPELASVQVRILEGSQELFLIRDEAFIEGEPGDIFSLLPLMGDAEGVTIEGAEYPLRGGRLPFAHSLGVSNVLRERRARVQVRWGLLLAIHIRR